MYICEGCREQVRPKSEPGIVFAAVLEDVSGFNPSGSLRSLRGDADQIRARLRVYCSHMPRCYMRSLHCAQH
jgi:hypothetical protein